MKKSEEIHKEAAGCWTGSAHLPLPEAGYLTSCHTTFQVRSVMAALSFTHALSPCDCTGSPVSFRQSCRRIKWVGIHSSFSGRPNLSLPRAILFMRKLIFRARVRIV